MQAIQLEPNKDGNLTQTSPSLKGRVEQPFYVTDRKRELKRKGMCRFGILQIEPMGDRTYAVLSDSGKQYIVSELDGRPTLCNCPYGDAQVEKNDFTKPCRHVQAVKQFKQEERFRKAVKENTRSYIKEGYLK